MKTLLLTFAILTQFMVKSGKLTGKTEQVILTAEDNKEKYYFEIELKDSIYKYISQDEKDTSIIYLYKNEWYELEGKNNFRFIK